MPTVAPHPLPAAAAYYEPVSGLQGDALRSGLQRLLRESHRPLGYDRARDRMFERQYRTGDSGAMTDLYTGASLTGVTDRASAAAHQVNTEHIWPQSLGASGPARSRGSRKACVRRDCRRAMRSPTPSGAGFPSSPTRSGATTGSSRGSSACR